MLENLSADVARYVDPAGPPSLRGALRALVQFPGLKAVATYRLGRWLLDQRSRWIAWPVLGPGWLLYALLAAYVRLAFDIRLHLSARIGPGMQVVHFGNILVCKCRIGRNCAIRQSVHIAPEGDGAGPFLGDNVWLGAHARVVGPFTVGDGATLGAGAVARRNVPERTFCLGDPARNLKRGYDNIALRKSRIF